jgi:hypothetical protein
MNRRFEPLHPIYKQKGYLYLFKNIILFFERRDSLGSANRRKIWHMGLYESAWPHMAASVDP